MARTAQAPGLSAEQALGIAQADARVVYDDLSHYRIRLALELDGWHIEYDPKDPGVKGGGPHYIIDSRSGAIVSRRYEQ